MILSLSPVGKFVYAGTPENNRTYSSVYGDCRLSALNSAHTWAAATECQREGEYILIDLGEQKLIAGTVIQPFVKCAQWVKEYKVQMSRNNSDWGSPYSSHVYNGHPTEITENFLPNGLLYTSRYVKIIVKSFEVWIAMRVDVIICEKNGILTSII